jgi:hypothetical protein
MTRIKNPDFRRLSSLASNYRTQAMTAEQSGQTRRFRGSKARWIFYLVIIAGIAAWKFLPRPWTPARVVETEHYLISSTATQEQTEQIGRVVEMLYAAYSNHFEKLPTFQRQHPKLKMLLYKDRKEFRWVNPNLGWAEAFYRKPYCRAYFSEKEINPYHWMLHEATHQLNEEVAKLKLAKWLDEGLAEYFSTSRIREGKLMVGRIDPQTYPVWWIDDIATVTNVAACVANGSVIPLRAIITNRGGPSMNKHFNLYYLHWWTLTHYLFENPKFRDSGLALLEHGGTLDAFEKDIGPAESVTPGWFRHVRTIKAAVAGNGSEFFTTGELPTGE